MGEILFFLSFLIIKRKQSFAITSRRLHVKNKVEIRKTKRGCKYIKLRTFDIKHVLNKSNDTKLVRIKLLIENIY